MMFITFDSSERIESKIMYNLSLYYSSNCFYICSFASYFKAIYNLCYQKEMYISSALWRSLPLVIIARLLRVRVVAFVWDYYPVTLSNVRYDNRFSRVVIDWLENVTLEMVHEVIVPTKDFLPFFDSRKTRCQKIWFCEPYRNPDRRKRGGVVKIVFAGQLNATRDIEGAYSALHNYFGSDFELFIASHNIPDNNLLAHQNLFYLGGLGKAELSLVYQSVDFGLVSLSKEFDGPGFPSKSFDYVSNGLPFIYYGPKLPHYEYIVEYSGVGFVLNDDNRVKKLSFDNFFYRHKKFVSETCLDI